MKEDQQKITVFELCRLHTIPFVEPQGIDLWDPNPDPGCSLEPTRTPCESDVLWVPNTRTSQVWGGRVGRGWDPWSSWRTHTRAPQCLLVPAPPCFVTTGPLGTVEKGHLWGLVFRASSRNRPWGEDWGQVVYQTGTGLRVGSTAGRKSRPTWDTTIGQVPG